MATFSWVAGRWVMAAFAALALSFPAEAFVYSSEKVLVRLVDRDTGKPIKSVIGVAIWEVEYPSLVTGRVYRPIAIEEAVSDAEGWIEFPSWKLERTFEASYTSSAPRILLYHEDYRPIFLLNEVVMERNVAQPAKSKWNRREVALERTSSDLRRQAEHLSEINARLPDNRDDPENPCWFERFPKMLAALNRMDVKFRHARIVYATRADEVRVNEAFLVSRGCRKASEVIAEGGVK